MMALAATGLLVPAIIHALPEVRALPVGKTRFIDHFLSLVVALILILTYLLGLLFSLKTHRELYNPESAAASDGDLSHDVPWSLTRSVVVLGLATVFVALVSEMLAGAIVESAPLWGLTQVFLGVVVVAIVGNAAEHSTALLMARKNQMDLAVGIALGSAQQVALFVAPVLVFVSYLRPEPMDLLFTTMEVVAVILGVLVAHMVAQDGESNWLEGVMLLVLYALLAMAFFVLPEPALKG